MCVTRVLGNIKLPPPLNFTFKWDVDDVDDVDVVNDDADDDDVDEMREKNSSSVCPNERHGESHKTLALRSQNALSRAAHRSWQYIYIYMYVNV